MKIARYQEAEFCATNWGSGCKLVGLYRVPGKTVDLQARLIAKSLQNLIRKKWDSRQEKSKFFKLDLFEPPKIVCHTWLSKVISYPAFF